MSSKKYEMDPYFEKWLECSYAKIACKYYCAPDEDMQDVYVRMGGQLITREEEELLHGKNCCLNHVNVCIFALVGLPCWCLAKVLCLSGNCNTSMSIMFKIIDVETSKGPSKQKMSE